MFPIRINIAANVNSLTFTEIYELLLKHRLEHQNKDKITIEFKGLFFDIETKVNMSIDYVITEHIGTEPKED